MKKLFAIVLSVVMVFGLVACGSSSTETTEAAAASDLQYVKDKGTIVIGITDFEPMDYKAEGSNDWIGFDADLAKAYAESIGVKVEFVEIDWDNKTMELSNKNIDLVWNGMTITDELKTSMNISDPYCNNAQIVVAKSDKISSITSKDDLKGLKVAVEAGSVGEETAKELGLDVTAVSTQSDAVLEVNAGTADICIIDSLMAAAMVGEGTDYAGLSYTLPLTEEYYGVGARLNSDIIDSLNAFLKSYTADGSLLKLAEQYKIQASIIK